MFEFERGKHNYLVPETVGQTINSISRNTKMFELIRFMNWMKLNWRQAKSSFDPDVLTLVIEETTHMDFDLETGKINRIGYCPDYNI